MNISKDLDNLWHNNNSFNNFLKNLRDLYNLLNCSINWNFNMLESIDYLNFPFNMINSICILFESVNCYGFLFNSRDLSDLSCLLGYLNNFLNLNLHLFNDLLSNWDWNNFIYILFNNFINSDKLRNYSFKLNNLMFFDHSLNYFLHFNNFWNFNNSLHNFLHNLLNWNLLSNSLFLWYNNLFLRWNLNNFLLNNILCLIYNISLNNLNNFINYSLHLLNFSIFVKDLNYFLNQLRNLNYFLLHIRNGNGFLYNLLNLNWNLDC